MSQYFASDFVHPMSSDDLSAADSYTQRDVMRTWFYQNFEDPAERTPYESTEGGYIWIWGGPYDATEELGSEFSDVVPEDVIEELVVELEEDCVEWAPTPRYEDYDYVLEDIALITEYFENFAGAIVTIEELLKTNVDRSFADYFFRLLYVNVITVLETYLSDAFISTVMNNPDLMRRFIETTPEFKSEKVPLADVFKAQEEAEEKARTYLTDVVWHHLKRVKPMYLDTLDIEFPEDLGTIFRAIRIRHDIVHRNGKTKEGAEIQITQVHIEELIDSVREFVQAIDAQLAELIANRQSNSDHSSVDGENKEA